MLSASCFSRRLAWRLFASALALFTSCSDCSSASLVFFASAWALAKLACAFSVSAVALAKPALASLNCAVALSMAPLRLVFSWRRPERSLSSLASCLVSSGDGTAERASLSLASLMTIAFSSDSTFRLRMAISRRAAAGSRVAGLSKVAFTSSVASAPISLSFWSRYLMRKFTTAAFQSG